MKKILLLTLLTFSLFIQAQEVSPYYPAKNNVTDPFNFTSQLTYFDLNYISNNISEFLTYRMNMVVEKEDDSKLLFDGGKNVYQYTDRIAASGSHNLIITYNVGKTNDIYVIKSVTISGDKERVYDFFVEFWKTTINFKEPSGKSDVSLLTGQDVVKLFFNKGKPYITVTNGTYKTIEEFNLKFNQLLASKNN